MPVSHIKCLVVRWRKTGAALILTLLMLLISIAMAACTGLNFGSSGSGSTPTATPSRQTLSKLTWCGKPLVLFRDEGAVSPTGTVTKPGTPTTITDWSQVQPELGFTVYLPVTLPTHTCLVSVSGTIHDPIFGGSFIIGYLLPDHSSISLSEAPLRSQSQQFQCSPSPASGTPTPESATPASGTATPRTGATATPTATPAQLCSGAKGNTDIFFSAPGTTAQLQQFFNALQPNVDWMPAAS